jgi:PPOX class probable F420-dependent enzyme
MNGELMELSPAKIEQLLQLEPVARMAVIAEDGFPQQQPIVFCCYQDCLWSPIDGKRKQGKTLQRIKNIQANPRASVLIDHYDSDWRQLWWLRMRVQATVVSLLDDDLKQQLEERLRQKYPQYSQTDLFREPATALKLQVLDMKSWVNQEKPL